MITWLDHPAPAHYQNFQILKGYEDISNLSRNLIDLLKNAMEVSNAIRSTKTCRSQVPIVWPEHPAPAH